MPSRFESRTCWRDLGHCLHLGPFPLDLEPLLSYPNAMHIEVLCTGDELLTGLTADTNSPYFMGKLFALGEKVVRAQTVGDVREDITSALLEVSQRAEAVLVSGGLGPTADDLTAECAAKAAGVALVEDPSVLESIKKRFAARGMMLSPNNLRQALVPRGAEVVPNPAGSAPMFILRIDRCTLFFVPGVPREYKALVDLEVLPRLKGIIEKQSNRIFRASRLLKTVGLPESHLDQLVKPLAIEHPTVVFGFRTQAPENHLKLMAEAGTQEEADRALAAAEKACRAILETFIFGADDDVFGACVGTQLARRAETLAIAESCTGGLTADIASSPAGASHYFRGSAVAYHESLKVKWAGVDPAVLKAHGAVSRQVAVAMAEGVRLGAGSTYGLGLTGVAGPTGGTAADPVGTVYIALSTAQGTDCDRRVFGFERDRVRAFAAYAALEMLRQKLRLLDSEQSSAIRPGDKR